jgi:ABC-type lipoprotein export system ATPase subunit
MIEISELAFRYPDSEFRLSIDRLAVEEGHCAALIGPSGCGKTTLLHLIAGIIPSQSGAIHVNGHEVEKLNDAERRLFRVRDIGFVFQDFALLDYLNLFDNILHPYRINPGLRLSGEVKQRARHLAESMGIVDKLRRFVGQTSQGELQRAAICRALVAEPAVILADEPTGNLDPPNKLEVIEILRAYARARQATLLVATHDHEILEAFDLVVDLRKWSG